MCLLPMWLEKIHILERVEKFYTKRSIILCKIYKYYTEIEVFYLEKNDFFKLRCYDMCEETD